MSYSGLAAAAQTDIQPIPVPETTITLAAIETGVPARTIRTWCGDWPTLARREGRTWLVDTDLLRELAKRRRTAGGPGTSAQPSRRGDPLPEYYSLTADEAADILGIPGNSIRRWCVGIPKLAMRLKGDRGEWRIEPVLLGIVAFYWRTETGALPEGALVRRSPQQRRLLHQLLKLLARIETGDVALPAHYLAAVETRIARRLKPPTPPDEPAVVQPSVGEAGNGTR